MKNNTMKMITRLLAIFALAALLTACGSSKKNISMKLHSDPLGAYVLLQVNEKGNEDNDWIFLGPTPIVGSKKLNFKGASSVSLKVIRPGFYEQVKTWSVRDFLKENREQDGIVWIPNMVKQ